MNMEPAPASSAAIPFRMALAAASTARLNRTTADAARSARLAPRCILWMAALFAALAACSFPGGNDIFPALPPTKAWDFMIRGPFFTTSLSAVFNLGGCLDTCSFTVRLAFSLVRINWLFPVFPVS